MKKILKIWDTKMYNFAVFIVQDKAWYEDGSNPTGLNDVIHTNSLEYACKVIHEWEAYCNRCNFTMYVFDMQTKMPVDVYKDEETGKIEYSDLTYANKDFTDEDFYNDLIKKSF